MNDWKEKTKLENSDKLKIAFHIIMAIFSIGVAIAEKDFTWMLVALLWINVAVMEYCDTKLMKGRDAIIDIQQEHIELQDSMINDLLEEINKKTKIVKLADIKIPEHFTKPRKDKMKRRIDFLIKTSVLQHQ